MMNYWITQCNTGQHLDKARTYVTCDMCVCVCATELPWISSLNVQYLLRYLLNRRKALTFAKSSNCIRQSIPYLQAEGIEIIKMCVCEIKEITLTAKRPQIQWGRGQPLAFKDSQSSGGHSLAARHNSEVANPSEVMLTSGCTKFSESAQPY